jgi:hypothetical protein
MDKSLPAFFARDRPELQFDSAIYQARTGSQISWNYISKRGMRLIYLFRENQFVLPLINGKEYRNTSDHSLSWRTGSLGKWLFLAEAAQKNQVQQQLIPQGQDISTVKYEVGPGLEFRPSLKWRLGTYFYRTIGESRGEKDLKVRGWKSKNQVQVQMNEKSTLTTDINLVNFKSESDIAGNNLVLYNLLNGNDPGTNLQVQMRYSIRLSNGLQFNMLYNGRSRQNLPFAHFGSLQGTILF